MNGSSSQCGGESSSSDAERAFGDVGRVKDGGCNRFVLNGFCGKVFIFANVELSAPGVRRRRVESIQHG